MTATGSYARTSLILAGVAVLAAVTATATTPPRPDTLVRSKDVL
ncbi:hypothetical protein [Nocardia wallacei]